jgi:diguanylate cyclase (GGDEF)-like protein
MAQISITQEQWAFLRGIVSRFASEYQQDFVRKVSSVVGSTYEDDPLLKPRQLAQLLMDSLMFPSSTIGDDLLQFLKRLILDERFKTAKRLEENRASTNNAFYHGKFEMELARFDPYFAAEWFLNTVAAPQPSFADYVNLEVTEKNDDIVFEKRDFDEKFHILQAPALFLPDLGYFRRKCGIRRKPVAVAYIDIDDFKQFNSDNGETNVDLNLLPRFMEILEAEIYQHGYAYRYGGDEYAVLMPNTTRSLATTLLREFQSQLRQSTYHNITGHPKVSIGLCVAQPDSHLTDREILHKAEQAKNFVKKSEKGRIGGYKTDLFRPEDLEFY